MPTKIENTESTKILYHAIPTNGISYINFYYDFSKLSQEKYKYLVLMTNLLGRIDTKNTDYPSLKDKLSTFTSGPIVFLPKIDSNYKDSSKHLFMVESNIKALDGNLTQALDVYNDIVNNVSFKNKAKIKDIIEQQIDSLKFALQNSASSIADEKLSEYILDDSNLSDEMSDLNQYKFLVDLDKNFDSKWDNVEKELNYVRDIVFNKNNLIASFTGAADAYKTFRTSLEKFEKGLSSRVYPEIKHSLVEIQKKQAIITQENIVSVMKGGNFKNTIYKYEPKMMVLSQIINSYLWGKVRVNGGAYGAGFSVNKSGMGFSSSDDPNMEQTLKVFDETADYIKNFKATPEEMKNYIIGSIGSNSSYSYLPSLQHISFADYMLMEDKTKDDVLNSFKEVLNTTDSDIRNYAGVLKAILDQNCYYVVGNGDIIKKNPDLFTSVKTVNEILK